MSTKLVEETVTTLLQSLVSRLGLCPDCAPPLLQPCAVADADHSDVTPIINTHRVPVVSSKIEDMGRNFTKRVKRSEEEAEAWYRGLK